MRRAPWYTYAERMSTIRVPDPSPWSKVRSSLMQQPAVTLAPVLVLRLSRGRPTGHQPLAGLGESRSHLVKRLVRRSDESAGPRKADCPQSPCCSLLQSRSGGPECGYHLPDGAAAIGSVSDFCYPNEKRGTQAAYQLIVAEAVMRPEPS
jgi:hypothetical protein